MADPTPEQIRQRAYELWQLAGSPEDGSKSSGTKRSRNCEKAKAPSIPTRSRALSPKNQSTFQATLLVASGRHHSIRDERHASFRSRSCGAYIARPRNHWQ